MREIFAAVWAKGSSISFLILPLPAPPILPRELPLIIYNKRSFESRCDDAVFLKLGGIN